MEKYGRGLKSHHNCYHNSDTDVPLCNDKAQRSPQTNCVCACVCDSVGGGVLVCLFHNGFSQRTRATEGWSAEQWQKCWEALTGKKEKHFYSINLEIIAEKQHLPAKKCPFNSASLAATVCVIESVSICVWSCNAFFHYESLLLFIIKKSSEPNTTKQAKNTPFSNTAGP